MEIYSFNRAAWNRRAQQGLTHTSTVRKAHLAHPLRGLDPQEWLGPSIAGQKALCLAAGGGLQSALAAAAGAQVTVFDLSDEMLLQDQQIASELGFNIECVQGTMEDLSAFGPAIFDLVLQPVSSCYVPRLDLVYSEIARVLKPGGIYISQHKQPGSAQASPLPGPVGYVVCHPHIRRSPLPGESGNFGHRESGTLEFLHTWEELIGELCRAGFVLEDLVEPAHGDLDAPKGSYAHRSAYLPPYVRLKARRTDKPAKAKAIRIVSSPKTS